MLILLPSLSGSFPKVEAASPDHELIFRDLTFRYESLLYEELQRAGIAFKSEEALRAAGFSKTPDVKLEVPIGVKGRIVNWIDSKACFGEEQNLRGQGTDQFQRCGGRSLCLS